MPEYNAMRKFDVGAQKPSTATVPTKVAAPSPALETLSVPKAPRKTQKPNKKEATITHVEADEDVNETPSTFYFKLRNKHNLYALKMIIKCELGKSHQEFLVDAINFYLENKGIDFTVSSPK